jgi:AraC-like DNA-binding protein
MKKNLFDSDNLDIFRSRIWVVVFVISIICTVLIIAFPYTQSRLPDHVLSLAGPWKIALEDNPGFAERDFDDSSWDDIPLPGDLVKFMIKKTGRSMGVCWLRKTVELDSGLKKEDLGLILGRIGNADETYVNGYFVGGLGSFPPHEFAMWNFPRNYRVPEEKIRFGENNVVAVRVNVHGMGEVLGNLGLAPFRSLDLYARTVNFVQVTMGYVAIAMGMALFMIFSFFGLKRFETDEYFYHSFQLALGLPIVLEICNLWPIYPSQLFRVKLLAFSWGALNVIHPISLHRIYNLERVWVERFLWLYISVVAFFCMFITTDDTIRSNGSLLIVTAIMIGFYNLSCHFSALYNKSPYSRLFSFFGIAVVICAIHDGFNYLNKYSPFTISFFGYVPKVMIFHVGSVFLYMGTSMILVSKFVSMTEEVEALNDNLETYIYENARLNQKLEDSNVKKKPLTVSTSAEEKIKDAIQHIRENYTDPDLTRESLSSMVGIHPDSFGRLFKKYTGVKLGDFIYEIRVAEAARRLRDEDTNVIDIAFDVGFESIRTFNRIFPKFMKTTPNRYRSQLKGTVGGDDD